jgi:SAM-dependent methyltransferase
MRSPRLRVRKLPYYLRHVAGLALGSERPHVVFWRLARPSGDVRLRGGLALRLATRLDLLVLAEIAYSDVYRLRQLPRAESLVVDVGAGVGEFALLAATMFPRSQVAAIEPNPGRFALLQLNVERCGLANIELHQVAVGLDGDRGQSLDGITGGRHVDLLKIDCEGAEVDVLSCLGAETLARTERVVLEWHNTLDARRDEAAAAILRRNGFEVTVEPDAFDPALGLLHAHRPPAPNGSIDAPVI